MTFRPHPFTAHPFNPTVCLTCGEYAHHCENAWANDCAEEDEPLPTETDWDAEDAYNRRRPIPI